MPALYNLAGSGLLSEDLTILGLDRLDHTDESWAAALTETMGSFTHDATAEFHAAQIDPRAWNWVRSRLRYHKVDFQDPAAYATLGSRLRGNVVFYLAVAARFFGPIVTQLGGAGLLKEQAGAFRRVVIEKPFGSDLPSAQALNREILAAAASTNSTGSTISSGRRQCSRSWRSASPTASSSQSGTTRISTMSRSPRPRRSASSSAAPSTSRPVRCATWCRTTCSSCSAWQRWSRRTPCRRRPCAARKRASPRRCYPFGRRMPSAASTPPAACSGRMSGPTARSRMSRRTAGRRPMSRSG